MTDAMNNRGGWEWLLILTLALWLCLVASGCSPRVINTIQHDTTYVDRLRVDSIYCRDSIYVKEQGDTLIIYKERWRDRYRYLRDTIRIVKVDSVAVERIKEVKVEKELTKWQRLKQRSFGWLLGACLALLCWTFRKPILKLIKR